MAEENTIFDDIIESGVRGAKRELRHSVQRKLEQAKQLLDKAVEPDIIKKVNRAKEILDEILVIHDRLKHVAVTTDDFVPEPEPEP